MLKQILIVLAALALLPLILKLIAKLRLLSLLLYALLAGTVFVRWTEANETMSMVVFFGILALTVISWVVTLYRRISENRRFERDYMDRLERGIAQGTVQAYGYDADGRYGLLTENK